MRKIVSLNSISSELRSISQSLRNYGDNFFGTK